MFLCSSRLLTRRCVPVSAHSAGCHFKKSQKRHACAHPRLAVQLQRAEYIRRFNGYRKYQRNVVVRCQELDFDELPPWQKRRIEEVYEQVNEVAGDCELPPDDVLHWLYWWNELPESDRTSMQRGRAASEEAVRAFEAAVAASEPRRMPRCGRLEGAQLKAARAKAEAAYALECHKERSDRENTLWVNRLSQAEETLGMWFSCSHHPPDWGVNWIADLHGMQREHVLAWFAASRGEGAPGITPKAVLTEGFQVGPMQVDVEEVLRSFAAQRAKRDWLGVLIGFDGLHI